MYKKLRCKLVELDMNQGDMCEIIGRKSCYISGRMQGRHPWTMTEAIKICDALGIPYTEIFDYFGGSSR